MFLFIIFIFSSDVHYNQIQTINMNKAYSRVVIPLFSHSFLIYSLIYSKLCGYSHLENVINDTFFPVILLRAPKL